MVRAGIVGATGLVGESLIRVLSRHPGAKLTVATSAHAAGKDVSAELPSLKKMVALELSEPSTETLAASCDVVFLAMKSAESMRFVPELTSRGVRCIDVGGEFRFRDHTVYEQWYGGRHEAVEHAARAVWGLPEQNRDAIRSADIIGNPGCYPTGAVLGLLPFVASGTIRAEGIVISSLSGVSGAGRTYSPKSENTFLACYDNVRAYGIGTHKHTPEIEQALTQAAGAEVKVSFVPHLVPIDRGILTAIYARPAGTTNASELRERLKAFAEKEPFLRFFPKAEDVRTANVRGTNFCDLGVTYLERTQQVAIFTAIDNTVKGAAGQAVQNMNIMFGLDETAGLDRPGY